jgi:DNA-directed RNA polymerase specialized sigma24 family protein
MNETELLKSYRPWLRTVASRMARQYPDRWEELSQEGWIAIWQASKKNQDALWLKVAAINKMRSVVDYWIAQMRDVRKTICTSEDDPLWEGLTVDLGDIALAYHHGEISAAIDSLSPGEQKYVFLKYWGGLTDTEMKEYFGYRPKTIGIAARQKLIKELAHLGAE